MGGCKLDVKVYDGWMVSMRWLAAQFEFLNFLPKLGSHHDLKMRLEVGVMVEEANAPLHDKLGLRHRLRLKLRQKDPITLLLEQLGLRLRLKLRSATFVLTFEA